VAGVGGTGLVVTLRYQLPAFTGRQLREAQKWIGHELRDIAASVTCLAAPTATVSPLGHALVVTLQVCGNNPSGAVDVAKLAVLTAASRCHIVLGEPCSPAVRDTQAVRP
jgi:hypothetical protein